jgi:hypothetical protein
MSDSKKTPCCEVEFLKEGAFNYPESFMRIYCARCGKDYFHSIRNVETNKIQDFNLEAKV